MDQSFMHFATGVGVGAMIATASVLAHRAYQYLKAVKLTEFDEPMTHHDLYEASQSDRFVMLLDYQAGELCEEFANTKEQVETLDQHLDEAMTRNTQLHKEVAQMSRIINKLQDQVGRGQIEIDHCRACCDELRAKLDAAETQVKEEAHDAYWQACDDNRSDRWSDTFDKDVRESFEKYWQENTKAGA